MIKVVLDTNVLVSALWTPAGNAYTIINLILTDRIIPCFDHRIINEYQVVLSRPRLAFQSEQINELLNEIINKGFSVTTLPSSITMPDESDRKFYDVTKFCNAYLVTGNIKHYPKDPLIKNPKDFLNIFNTNFAKK